MAKSKPVIWIILCIWYSLFAIISMLISIICSIYRAQLVTFYGERLVEIMRDTCIMQCVWMVLTLGITIRTARTKQRMVGNVLLLFAFLGFSMEFTVLLILSYTRKMIFNKALIEDSISTMIKKYNASSVVRSMLDRIHSTFKCCGIDEWHREWSMVTPWPPRLEVGETGPWVPNSCCMKELKTSVYCGFSTISHAEGKLAHEVIFNAKGPIPDSWYRNLMNEPCPEKVREYFGELPVYIFSAVFAMAFSRMAFTIYAVVIYTRRRYRKKQKTLSVKLPTK